MLRDQLQKRLEEVKEQNPSFSRHSKSFLDLITNKFSFLQRYFTGSVQKYPAEQRAHDILLRAKAEADHIMFYRSSVGGEELARCTEYALLYK